MRSFHSGVMHGGTDRLRSADLRATDIRTGDTRKDNLNQSRSSRSTHGQTRVCGEAAIAHTDDSSLALESYSTRRERGRQYESI